MAEKWMQAQQVDKGYIVIMLTKIMVIMVTRCCNMTIIEQLPISEKDLDFKTSQNQCHGRKQLKASRVCNFRGF